MYTYIHSYPYTYINRCNLGGALLQIISLGIRDVHKFDFIDKPSKSVRRHRIMQ